MKVGTNIIDEKEWNELKDEIGKYVIKRFAKLAISGFIIGVAGAVIKDCIYEIGRVSVAMDFIDYIEAKDENK